MKKIIYFVIIGITIYLNILYDWKEGALALSVEVVFLFLCFLESYFVQSKLNARIIVDREMIQQGEEIPVLVEIQNKSNFPTEIRGRFFVQYGGEKKKRKQIWKKYIQEKTQEKITKYISTQKCGKMIIGLPRISVSDWWGGFSFSKRIKVQEEILIMPRLCPVNLIVSYRTRWFLSETEEYAKDKSGDDNTEIYEIREYRNGDRMQKVHWKISANQEELYVKEYSYPLGAGVIFFLAGGKLERCSQLNISLFLQGVASISMAMIEKKCVHYIAWKMKDEPLIYRRLIKDEETFYQFMLELLEMKIDMLEENVEEQYCYEYRNETHSSKISFTNALELQVNQQEILQVNQELERFFETVEIVV